MGNERVFVTSDCPSHPDHRTDIDQSEGRSGARVLYLITRHRFRDFVAGRLKHTLNVGREGFRMVEPALGSRNQVSHFPNRLVIVSGEHLFHGGGGHRRAVLPGFGKPDASLPGGLHRPFQMTF